MCLSVCLCVLGLEYPACLLVAAGRSILPPPPSSRFLVIMAADDDANGHLIFLFYGLSVPLGLLTRQLVVH